MVACLMRLSPLPVRARRKDLRRCASIKRLARAAASAPFVAGGRNFVEDQTHGKNRIIHRSGYDLHPSLFLQCVICHRSAIISGKARSTRRRPFPSPPRPSFAQSKFDRRPTDDWRGDVFPSVRAFRLRSQRACRVGFARMYRRRRCSVLLDTGEPKNVLTCRGGDGEGSAIFLPSLDVIVTSPEGDERGELD